MKLKAIFTFLTLFLLTCLSAQNVSIYEIQYTTNPSGDSPYMGQTVTTSGIVTAFGMSGYNDNFFISMPEGGAWKGVYIYMSEYEPNPGDMVEVTGTVAEYYNFTEISGYSNDITVTPLSSGNPIPEPTVITTDELSSSEAYEGVLVKIENVTVTDVPDEFGQWYVSDGSGNCQIDDGIYQYPNPQIGDIFESITGVVDYGYDEYGLHPRDINDFGTGEDTTPPELANAIATSATTVNLTFSESISPGTAENSDNYFILELPITSAVLQGNGFTVTLTTSEQNPGQSYTIVVNNIEDLSENVIANDSEISFSGYQSIEMDLFFSEYIEGSSNNKALEIYNGTGTAVDLSGYEIWRISNGGDWAEGESNAVSLDGILENNDVYVICNSSANAEIQAVSDLIGTTATYYNGNDAVGLAHNGILIDAIGEEGPDVGIAWDVAGTTEATLNHTLVRKPDILQGNMNWALSAGTNTENSEWFVYNEDTFNYLGYHSVSGEDTFPPIMTSALATSITSVEITFNEALDETTSEDITNYSITPYLNISSASLSNNNVILTTDEQVEEQLYTITVNNVEDLVGNPIAPESTIDFTGYNPAAYDLIADIQADPSSYEGQIVTICGIVTIGVNVIQTGNTNAYVQDNSERGINIYNSTVIDELERGNLVEITGEVTQYFNTTEITDPIVTVLSTGNPEPEPQDFYLGDASDFELEGTLLRVKGEIIDVWSASGGTNIEIKDDQNNEITVRVWDTTGLNLAEYVEGFNLQAVGIGDVFNEMQIVPGYQDQLSEVQDIEENVTTDPENPLAGEEVTVTFTNPDPVDNALLFWKTASDLEYEYIEMYSVDQKDISYQGVIPGQSQGTVVYYYLVIIETTGESYSIPENAPEDDVMSYSYKVTSLKAILNIPAKPFDPYAGEKFPIEFATEIGNKAILRIYNAEGKLVLTPKNIIVPHPGISTYEWDGRDKDHKLLPLGLYICYLEVVDTDTGKKKSAKAPIVIGAPLK